MKKPKATEAYPEPIRVPCEWVCPECRQMETDELARDTHECDPELLSLNTEHPGDARG